MIFSKMKQTTATEYLIAGIVGFLVGLRLIPGEVLGLIYMFIGGVCFYFAFNNDKVKVFTILPYLIFTEIFMRRGAGSSGLYTVSGMPYLFMDYLLIGVFGIMVLRHQKTLKLHSKSVMFIFFFFVIELLDLVRSSDIVYGRSMVTNSLVLLIVSLWACSNFLGPKLQYIVIRHLKLATVYLCGNILVAHFTHDISYSVSSSSEASNRMSAVQLSGYLGVGSSLLFLAIMNEKLRNQLVLHLVLFTVATTLMVLTFSRGGLYFLSAVIILYVLFNRQQVGKFLILFLLLPIGYLIYYYVSETTNGMIEKRYSEEGSSGRDELVAAGIKLFEDEPLAGVGTGNFGQEIIDRELYGAESGAHNEFVRAVAEHGVLGIITYWGFYLVIIAEIIKRKKKERDMAIYLLVLYCLIIVHNGLKISIQPFLLVLVIATPTLIHIPRRKHVQALPNVA
jgi:O-antigen ligase